MINFRIGCSGYHYAEWKDTFYPADLPKAKWFEFYCEHFNAIELNMTFYKFPRGEFLNRLYDRAPDNFSFSVKAPRTITHFKKLQDTKRYLAAFYTAIENGLREKAGCILFQFPTQFDFSAKNLESIVEMMDPTFQSVVEFRHASWWREEVFRTFEDNHIIFSGTSHPRLPDPIVRTNKTLYYRMHGVPHLYSSSYSFVDLESLASQIIKYSDVKEAYVFFNNTHESSAVVNGKQLQEIIELVH